MKSILISIQPKWIKKIVNEEKTIEMRKTAPKQVPFKCYIYATKGTIDNSLLISKDSHHAIIGDYRNAFNCDGDGNIDWNIGNGKVIGEFVCDKVDVYDFSNYEAEYRITHIEQKAMCLNQPELIQYGDGQPLYGWHISDLKIYDEPKRISDFLKPCPDPFHYCTICKHCVKVIPPDEEEYALYHGGQFEYWEEHCTNRLTAPPRSWRYVEENE